MFTRRLSCGTKGPGLHVELAGPERCTHHLLLFVEMVNCCILYVLDKDGGGVVVRARFPSAFTAHLQCDSAGRSHPSTFFVPPPYWTQLKRNKEKGIQVTIHSNTHPYSRTALHQREGYLGLHCYRSICSWGFHSCWWFQGGLYHLDLRQPHKTISQFSWTNNLLDYTGPRSLFLV